MSKRRKIIILASIAVVLTIVGYLFIPEFNRIRTLAYLGDSNAQYHLGAQYYTGTGGVKLNYDKGFKWLLKSVKNGNKDAQYDLALAYRDGHGTVKNLTQYIYWLESEAKYKGTPESARAQYELSYAYYTGLGVEKNYKLSFKWTKTAVDNGADYFNNALYESFLADDYFDGSGTNEDDEEAFKWYKKSAENGSSYSMDQLAAMYANGEGIAENYPEAIKWALKATNAGNLYSASRLCDMYMMSGNGVVQNYEQAYMWCTIYQASLINDEVFDARRAEIDKRIMSHYLTPSQLQKSRQMAADWLKAHNPSS